MYQILTAITRHGGTGMSGGLYEFLPMPEDPEERARELAEAIEKSKYLTEWPDPELTYGEEAVKARLAKGYKWPWELKK